MTKQIKTSVGTLTRTSSSSGAKWAISGLTDSDRAFNGSLKSLRQVVREKFGEQAEAEILDAAQMLRRLATGAK
jgi:hypothetical protein